MDGTVLVADDDRTIRTVLTQALTRAGCKVHATSSMETLRRWVREGMGDLVISDVVMPDGNGLEALPEIARLRPGLPVIIISAQNTIMTAIRATEAEAFDYLPKPFDLPDLMQRAARALKMRRRRSASAPPRRAAAEGGRPGAMRETQGEGATAPGTVPGAASGAGPRITPGTASGTTPPTGPAGPDTPAEDLPLIGRTAPMQDLYRLIARVIHADLPVLIEGESGTGKSLIARAIHDLGPRRAGPFASAGVLDLADPVAARDLMQRARGGTLVIEEPGDLGPQMQALLVRLLDLPAAREMRLLATSRRDLAAALAQGRLREDLYFRLASLVIRVPRLSARIEDIPLLARHFLAAAPRRGAGLALGEEARELLCRYSWPGNVRQLENVMKRLALTTTGPEIRRADVEAALAGQPEEALVREGGDSQTLSQSVAAHLRRHFDLHQGSLPPRGLYRRILAEMERPLIEISLEATGGNQARCAELLGINRNTLRKKIADLDIRVTRRRKLM